MSLARCSRRLRISAALNEGLIKPTDIVDTQGGVINVNGLKIHDSHKIGTGDDREVGSRSLATWQL